MKKSVILILAIALPSPSHANAKESTNNSRYEFLTNQCNTLLKNIDNPEKPHKPHEKVIVDKIRNHAIIIMALLSVLDAKQQLPDNTGLTIRQKKILSILAQGPLKRQEMMHAMQTKLSDRSIQLDLKKLKELGLIDSQEKGKATLWHLVTP